MLEKISGNQEDRKGKRRDDVQLVLLRSKLRKGRQGIVKGNVEWKAENGRIKQTL